MIVQQGSAEVLQVKAIVVLFKGQSVVKRMFNLPGAACVSPIACLSLARWSYGTFPDKRDHTRNPYSTYPLRTYHCRQSNVWMEHGSITGIRRTGTTIVQLERGDIYSAAPGFNTTFSAQRHARQCYVKGPQISRARCGCAADASDWCALPLGPGGRLATSS